MRAIKSNRILILGVPKTGTTALYYRIRQSLPGNPYCCFEPLRPGLPLQLRKTPWLSPIAGPIFKRLVGHLGPMLVKALINPDRQRPKDYQRSSLGIYDRIVMLIRDPRDTLISFFLYHNFHSRHTRDPYLYYQSMRALRLKEARPSDIALESLLGWQERLETEYRVIPTDVAQLGVTRHLLDHLRFQERLLGEIRASGLPLELVRYEDMIAGNLPRLEAFLGFPLQPTPEIGDKHRRVVRTRGSGDWQNWFTGSDVAYFRPLFDPFLGRFGYDRSWLRKPDPEIASASASGYLQRLFEEVNALNALAWDASAFNRLESLSDLEPGTRAWFARGIEPAAHPANAESAVFTRNARIEDDRGLAVNVLLPDADYRVRFEVGLAQKRDAIRVQLSCRDLRTGRKQGLRTVPAPSSALTHHPESRPILACALNFHTPDRPGAFMIGLTISRKTSWLPPHPLTRPHRNRPVGAGLPVNNAAANLPDHNDTAVRSYGKDLGHRAQDFGFRRLMKNDQFLFFITEPGHPESGFQKP